MDNTAQKIPFKVSARTARLIGRENIATAKGAIIELVKNGYDADSKISLVYFNNIYSNIHTSISIQYYNDLLSQGISKDLLDSLYINNDEEYLLRDNVPTELFGEFKLLSSRLSSLYIIDTGEGMTQQIIRNHWMTIGTDNKTYDYFTKTGRIKSGAKGIGRFALDKLGSKCEMITFFNPDYHEVDLDSDGNKTDNVGYRWRVNWEDFEGEFKTIGSVDAELTGLRNTSLQEFITNILPSSVLNKINNDIDYKYGTILKITDLRDSWDEFYVNQVFTDLEVLIPPKETGGFDIFLYSSLNPTKYGEILGSACDDFDYKIIAKADDNQNVRIKIIRKEYDVDLIPQDLFKRPNMSQTPYDQATFRKSKWRSTKTFSQLMPGFAESDKDETFKDIGAFEFSFYFLKKSYTTPDANRFFYKKFQSSARKDWLEKFGGIKLFRDNFRVRPYGEVKDIAFDWLGLGNRKANSPAGVAKEDGGYRVEPENVAGAIKISRLTNVNFEDKSSREGLQDNKTFQIFKQLIAAIINIFEEDRSHIAREMAAYDNLRYGPERDKKAASELARKILSESRRKKEETQGTGDAAESTQQGNNEDNRVEDEKEILAGQIESQEEEIEKLKSEQQILRGLASSGIVLASFSHDLSKLNDFQSSRTTSLERLLQEKISESDYNGIEERKNPFVLLERIKTHDIKMQNWLNFSLGATRKDKRKRRQLFLNNYFSLFKEDWQTILDTKGVKLDTTKVGDVDLRVFEIDIDSIFNNLLVNSLEAFRLMKINRDRIITIKTDITSKEVIIDYTDSGPGLSPDIDKPEKIFEPLVTTRRNPYTGEEEGTGLGMWIIKSIVTENDGIVKLLYPEYGFGIRIIFPTKYK